MNNHQGNNKMRITRKELKKKAAKRCKMNSVRGKGLHNEEKVGEKKYTVATNCFRRPKYRNKKCSRQEDFSTIIQQAAGRSWMGVIPPHLHFTPNHNEFQIPHRKMHIGVPSGGTFISQLI